MQKPPMFSASLMCGQLLKLEQDINTLKNASSINYIHVDISDGLFSSNIIFGYEVVRLLTEYPISLDIHLMMTQPSQAINQLRVKPFDLISFHIECEENPTDLITMLKEIGCKVGLFIKRDTALTEVYPYINQIDVIYLMMSQIGYSANICTPDETKQVIQRVRILRKLSPNVIIGVDGGVKFGHIRELYTAGVNLFVLGKNSLFSEKIEKGLLVLDNFIMDELNKQNRIDM